MSLSTSSARLHLIPGIRDLAAEFANTTVMPVLPVHQATQPPNATLLGIAPMADLDAAIARVSTTSRRAVAPTPTVVEEPTRWQEFEELGLKAKPTASTSLGKLVVSSYRLLGFLILTLIVVVLVSYIATTVFYFLNHTWIAPVAVSAGDERVVTLQAELAAQQDKRDKIVDDLEQSERTIAAEQGFQIEFARSIKHDRDGRKVALGNARSLAGSAAAARKQISRTNDDYAASANSNLQVEYSARLIDRHDMLAGKFQLAQIQGTNLSLAERQLEFQQRAAELATETASLDAIVSNQTSAAALSYDVLKIKHDYDASKLVLAKELKEHESLKTSLARQEKLIATLSQSAYLRAIAHQATVAFIPYGNVANATKGTKIYRCRLSMVICREAGTVIDLLPGEVTFKHPRGDKTMRGQMVELRLTGDEPGGAEEDVLFVGAAPLLM